MDGYFITFSLVIESISGSIFVKRFDSDSSTLYYFVVHIEDNVKFGVFFRRAARGEGHIRLL